MPAAFRADDGPEIPLRSNRVKANRFEWNLKQAQPERAVRLSAALRNSEQNLFESARQRPVECAPSGVFVTTAPQPRCNRGHIHLAPAAQAQPDKAFGQLAQEDRDVNAGNAQRNIHDAFAVLFRGAAPHHVLVRDP